jgi:transcription termination/antitermination protein NusA
MRSDLVELEGKSRMELENVNLNVVLDQVGKEKNLDREILVDALKQAMLTAARRKLGLTSDLEAHYNDDLGEVEIFEFKTIVADVINPSVEISLEDAKLLDPDVDEGSIGGDLGVKVDSTDFGRIAAQTAKQVIIQRVREAERTTTYDEYKDRKGELITGIVRRFERGNVIVDLGRAEAVLPTREQVPRENIRSGDRVIAYVLDVLEVARGPQIILSRVHPNLVVKLFQQEVPEIEEGIVVIEAAAREAGVRTKIAVHSRDPEVDPVGACVGMKGARVQAVVQELRGEKIDIVPWDEDEARFVCNALSPAEVTRVLVDESNHSMQMVVPDDQLSLAIGRRGQNVRLAAQLSGWKIDITSETKVGEEKLVAWASLSRVEGLSEILVQTLYNHGFRCARDVVESEPEFLEELPGFNAEAVPRLQVAALKVIEEEGKEAENLKEKAREDARLLMIVNETILAKEAAEDLSEIDFSSIEGCDKYVSSRLSEYQYMTVDDVFFDSDEERLVQYAGFSQGKARQIRFAAAQQIEALTNGKVKSKEKPLSEPELRDAEQYDETHAGQEATNGAEAESDAPEAPTPSAEDTGSSTAEQGVPS